jgi:3-hydroxyacyl-[acyl-carrier-protein] dehydratase
MRWMWLDRVVLLEPGVRLVAIKHVSLAEDHLHDHFPREGDQPALPIMPASLIIEGMAQAAGILVGHAQDFREKVVLAKISKADLREDAGPGCTLRYTATIQRMDRSGASTAGLVELIEPLASGPARARPIGAIDLMFSHLDQNMAGMQFPEHNFVFGESFKTLLRSSGVLA